jgi:cell division protein FtsW
MVKNNPKKPDTILLSAVIALLVFGLMMIASAGVVLSKVKFGDDYFFFKHQLFWGIIPGLILLFIVQRIDYQKWRKFAMPFFFIALIALVLVFIPGIGSQLQGASRWIMFGPISFQPTEMMKLAIIFYLALWIESRGDKVKKFSEGLIPFIFIIGVVSFLVIKQPDMGTLGLILLVAVTMFFIGGVPVKYLLGLLFSGALLSYILVKIEPYRMNRILTFMNPELDPRGISYQINQALIAVSTGGIFGLGIGHSRQKFNYLPEPVGDSIFAIIAEELGMLGSGVLILLFLVIALRGYKVAKNAPDKFGKLLAVGITSWIVFQALINMMSIVGVMPMTGIPLPFVSYGSTSLIFVLIGTGVLLNISRYSKME